MSKLSLPYTPEYTLQETPIVTHEFDPNTSDMTGLSHSDSGQVQPLSQSHNAAIPIHSLPAELFLEILFLSIILTTPEGWYLQLLPQLRNLARVCSHWYHSILSNPRFWCMLHFKEAHHAQAVLKRNPGGPLIVYASGEWRDVEGHLRVAREHVHRWEVVTLFSDFRPQVAELGDSMPLLKRLKVVHTGNHRGSLLPFSESSTPALVHLTLDGVRLPWESMSFSRLKFLSLSTLSSGDLSLPQLIGVLLASPNLEWLGLQVDAGAREWDEEPIKIVPEGFRGQVPLLALRGLDLADPIQVYFNCGIYAPNYRLLGLSIGFEVFLQYQTQIAELVKIPMQADDISITVQYTEANSNHVSIKAVSDSLMGEERLSSWAESGRTDAAAKIRVYSIPPKQDQYNLVIQALRLPVEKKGVTLNLGYSYNPASTFLTSDLALWDDIVSQIIFQPANYYDVVPALRYLSEPYVGDGAPTWPCPRLQSIHFPCPSHAQCKPEGSLEALWGAIRDFGENRAMAGGADAVPFAPIALLFRGRQWEFGEENEGANRVQLVMVDGM